MRYHSDSIGYGATKFMQSPVLPFLVFFEKMQGKPTKQKGFLIPTEPLKSLEKKGKPQGKNKESPRKGLKKNKEFQKQGKGRTRMRRIFLRENPPRHSLCAT